MQTSAYAAAHCREEGIPRLELEPIPPLAKTGKDDSVLTDSRIRSQKQEGLYYVEYKPLGGVPDIQVFQQLLRKASQMEGAQLRLNADETCYIINLTAEEARKIAALTEKDTAHTAFEHSVSCIGATVCQQGLCDSHGTLARIAAFLKEQGVDTVFGYPGGAILNVYDALYRRRRGKAGCAGVRRPGHPALADAGTHRRSAAGTAAGADPGRGRGSSV